MRTPSWLAGGFCVAAGLASVGCVERRMTVVSDPPGAMVSVNGQEIGPAPVDLPSDKYIYNGDYDITMKKDGYETLLVKQPVPAKWYQYPFIDFFSENVVPWHIKDRRTFSYQMLPTKIVPNEELLQTAAAIRQQGQSIGTPLPAERRQPREILPEPKAGARLERPMPN